MRKFFCFLTVFAGLLMFCGCNAAEMGSLPEFSEPYVGVYECTALRLGGEEMRDKFSSVRLELGEDGTFALTYRTATGSEGSYGGTYSVDPDAEEIVFSAASGFRTVTRTFPFRDGAVLIDLNLAGRPLHAEFRMP